MVSINVKVIDPVGLHARPVSILVREASKYSSSINIGCGDKEANLKSIMSVLSLSVKSGSEITISANGNDEQEAIDALEKVMKENSII